MSEIEGDTMKVTLLHHTPLEVCVHAIRTCHNSFDKSDTTSFEICPNCGSDNFTELENTEHGEFGCLVCRYTFDYPNRYCTVGEKDKELIDRVGNKFKHSSTLEHLVYTFYIQGISRACLQELARHRIASLSVKSTRYTLKELQKERPFYGNDCKERAKKYIVLTGNEKVDNMLVTQLENLRLLIAQNISNDLVKYALPECYRTELTYTINARSLQNFLELRTDKSALWEIRDLAHEIYNALPESHKYLFKDYLKYNSNKNEAQNE